MNIIKQDKYSIKVKYGKNLGNLTTIWRKFSVISSVNKT
jgi:hypothetical protein